MGLIDFSYDDLIEESLGIFDFTNGGFSFSDLCEMPMDLYILVVKKINVILDKRKNKGE